MAILKELLGDELQKVLDAGCGKGRIAIPLAEFGHMVTGVDLTPELLDEARQKSQEKNLQIIWVEANLANLESIESGSQDAVIVNRQVYCDIIGIRNQISGSPLGNSLRFAYS